MNNKIAVVMGNDSGEAEITRISGNGIIAALLEKKVNVEAFDLSIRNINELANYSKAFLITHGKNGEDGKLQGLLEYLKVPYTGSGVMASSIGMDKYRTKLIWSSLNIPNARCQFVEKSSYVNSEFTLELDLPVIVKPADDGSSLGLTKVYKSEELPSALELVFAKSNKALIESLIIGEEYTIPVMDGVAYPIVQIKAPQGEYDFHNKYFSDDTKYQCPSDLNPATIDKINKLAVKAYHAIGANGVARIDFMIDKASNIFLLEINTLPGMTGHSLVPMSFQAAGINYGDLCLKILDGAGLNK